MDYNKEFLKKVIYSSVGFCNEFIQHRMQEMARTDDAKRDNAWQTTYGDLVRDWEKCEEIVENDILILTTTDREIFQGFDPELSSFLNQTFYDCKELITDMYESQKKFQSISNEEKSTWTYDQRLQEYNVDNWIQEIEEAFETESQQEMIEVLDYLSTCKFNFWGERKEEEGKQHKDEDELPF